LVSPKRSPVAPPPKIIPAKAGGPERPPAYHKNLKQQTLLVECSGPYNSLILAVQKCPNKWRLVQDLRLINEAVVPL
jgi:hypothetical protein